MSMLGYYAKKVAETKGLEHVSYLSILRYYIKNLPEEDIRSTIADIHNLSYLRALWEAGLSSNLQDSVIRRMEELTHARGT